VSVVAGVVAAEESVAGAVTDVESEVFSVFVELPLQADSKAAAAKTTNNFFILFNFRFLNISCLFLFLKKVTHVFKIFLKNKLGYFSIL
jgi:hypothetical protein